MNGTFETIGGPAAWSADGDGLEVRVGRRTRRIAWTEATTAALVRFPAAGAGLPVGVLPGLGHLRALNRRQAVAYAQLVLARGLSSSRAVRVTVPLDGASAGLLVGAVRDAMGSRWRGEVPFEAHMAVLGLRRPWWTLPALLLFLAADRQRCAPRDAHGGCCRRRAVGRGSAGGLGRARPLVRAARRAHARGRPPVRGRAGTRSRSHHGCGDYAEPDSFDNV